jgi:predicted ferric reductase
MAKKLRLALALLTTALLAYTLYSTIKGQFEMVLAAPGCIASLALQRKYPHLAALLSLLSASLILMVAVRPNLGPLVEPIAPLPVNVTG